MSSATTNYLPNRKQLIALSQLMLVVCIAAFFFRLRLVESSVARNEFRSLASLHSLSRLPIHQTFTNLRKPDDFSLQAHLEVQKPLADWLKANRAEVDTQHINARQQVTNWLINQGVPETVIKDATGKGHGETIPFLFFNTPLRLPD